MTRLLSCEPNGVYSLWLTFDDGVEGRVDLINLLELGAFAMLRKPERFDQVRVGGAGEVSWACGVRLDPDVLYADLLAKGCKPLPGARGTTAPATYDGAKPARWADCAWRPPAASKRSKRR